MAATLNLDAQWVKLSQFNGNFYNEVYFASTTVGFITSHSGTIYRTTDGGDSWNTVSLPDAGSSSNRDLVFPTAQTGFISGEDGIWKSTDAGATWSEVTPAGATGISSSSCWFRNANVGVWGYGNCRDTIVTFWRTTDGGSSWSVVYDTASSSDVAVGGMTYSGGEFKASGGSGKFWRSTDDGATWTFSNTGSAGWQEDLIANQGTLLIASANGSSCSSTGGGKIMRSTDGGSNWTATAFPSVVMWGVSMYSSSRGVAVGDRGAAFLTTDGGATWTNHSCGLGANDRLDDVYMVSSTNGFAVGDGVYRYRLDTFAVIPDTIDFGNVVIGTVSPYQNAILRSLGTAGTITGRAFSGTDAASFTSNANFGVNVPVPGCLDVPTPVRFEPTRAGTHAAQLDMTLGGGAGTYSVVLLGNGVRPRLTVSDSLWFDSIRCETEGTDSIEVRNLGNHQLVIEKVDIANDLGFFSLLSPSTPVTIPPFSSNFLVFRARASGTGTMAARAYLTTNDPDYADSTRVIQLRMVRKRSTLDETPDTLRIPSARFGESSTFCLELANSIDEAISITGIPSVDNVPEITVSLKGDPRIESGSTRELCFTGAALDSVDRCETFLLRSTPCQNERKIVVCYQARPAGLALPEEIVLEGPCENELQDTFLVVNDGEFDLRLDSVRILGPSGLTDMQDLPRNVSPGDTIPVEIRLDGRGRGQVSGSVVVYYEGRPDTIPVRAEWIGPELAFATTLMVVDPICQNETLQAVVDITNRGEEAGSIVVTLHEDDPGRLDAIPALRNPGDSLPYSFRILDLPQGTSELRLFLEQGCGAVDTLRIEVTVQPPPVEFADSIIDLVDLAPGSGPVGFEIEILNASGIPAEGVRLRPIPPDEEVVVPSSPFLIPKDGVISTGEIFPEVSGQHEALIVLESDLPCHVTDTLRMRWRVRSGEPEVLWTSGPVDGGCDSIVHATITLYAPDDRGVTLEDLYPAVGIGMSFGPSVYPTVVDAGDSLDVNVTITFAGTPFTVDTVLVRVDTQVFRLPVQVSWERPQTERVDPEGVRLSAPVQVTRFSGCSEEESVIYLKNFGQLTDSLRVSSSSNLLSAEPSPLTVLPGETVEIRFRVGALDSGDNVPEIILFSEICETEFRIPVSVTTIEGPIDGIIPVDLGNRCRDSLSLFHDTLRMRSGFPVEATLEDISIDGDGTWSVEAFQLLQDRSALVIDLSISPGAPDDAVLALSFSEPCETIYLVPISSTGEECRKSDVVLEAGRVTGDWGDTVRIPVVLHHRGGPMPETVPVDLQYDERFLSILTVDPTSSGPWLVDRNSADESVGRIGFTVVGPGGVPREVPRLDTILWIRSVILRGPVSYSDVVFDSSYTPDRATVIRLNGRVSLTDFCDAEGRLLQVTGQPGIRSVVPNPTDRFLSVRYFVPVLTVHTISIVNNLGQIILRFETRELPPGERIEQIDLTGVATGQYILVIDAGRFRFTEEIYLR